MRGAGPDPCDGLIVGFRCGRIEVGGDELSQFHIVADEGAASRGVFPDRIRVQFREAAQGGFIRFPETFARGLQHDCGEFLAGIRIFFRKITIHTEAFAVVDVNGFVFVPEMVGDHVRAQGRPGERVADGFCKSVCCTGSFIL